MAVLATDDFNRANSSDLGANWDAGYTDHPACKIENNSVTHNPNVDSLETYNAVTPPDAQYAQVKFTEFMTENLMGVLLRFANAPTVSGYLFCAWRFGSDTGETIYRMVNGSFNNIAENSPATWATNDVLQGQANGSTLKLFKNGVERLSVVDTTYTSGKAGIYIIYFTGGTWTPGNEARLDDFEVGSLSSTNSYSYTGSGGIVLGGSAALKKGKVYQPSGGIVLAGNAGLSKRKVYVPTGGIVLAGAAALAKRKVYVPSGGISFLGAAQTELDNGELPPDAVNYLLRRRRRR
jgi:hypothetical protein